MKKKTAIVVVLLLTAAVCLGLFACGEKTEKTTINIAVPDGAPALAIAKLLSHSDFDGYDVKYEIVAGATEIAAKMTTGSADIAIMPTNLAAKLYTNGTEIKLVAGNTFGQLYVVGTEEIISASALRGKKILCIGQGQVPDFMLSYVLSQYGITSGDVTIKYIAEGSDAVAELKQGTAQFALLAEPAASMAIAKAEASVLIDIQEEWKIFTGNDGYPQASTIVRNTVFSEHSAFLKAFLTELKNNVSWITENVAAVNSTLKAYNSKMNFATAEIIRNCNVRYVGALEAKASIESYLEVMRGFNAQFVGAELPDAGFYAGVSLD